MQSSCLKTSAWWSRGSHFVENGYPSQRFPNMVKVNIYEHWTRVTRFNPLWVSVNMQECLVFFLWRKGSFSSRNRPSRNSTLFLSRRSAWSVLKCNHFAKFSGIFWTLWTRKLCFWWGFQYEFLNVSQTFYTFFSSALKKNPKMRLYLKWILCWILPCAQPILLTWTDPRSG